MALWNPPSNEFPKGFSKKLLFYGFFSVWGSPGPPLQGPIGASLQGPVSGGLLRSADQLGPSGLASGLGLARLGFGLAGLAWISAWIWLILGLIWFDLA